jgi:hypothetical protein
MMSSAVSAPAPAVDARPEADAERDEFARRLKALLADCRAMAAQDHAIGTATPSYLGKLVGGEPPAPMPCPHCWYDHTCEACVRRDRERGDALSEGQRLRRKLDRLAAAGRHARFRQARRRVLDQHWLDLFYVAGCIALVDQGHDLLERHHLRALVLGWAADCAAAAPVPPSPRPVIEPGGPHPLERGVAVIEWLIGHQGTRRDLEEAVGDAFVDQAQRDAWRPAPPPRKAKTDSDERRAAIDAAQERYQAAIANGDAARKAHGHELLQLALSAWFGELRADDT